MIPENCSTVALVAAVAAIPFGFFTFILGAVLNRFTMSKKEQVDVEQTKFKTSADLMEKQNAAYNDLVGTMPKVVANQDAMTVTEFTEKVGRPQEVDLYRASPREALPKSHQGARKVLQRP
jgi:hypothetical protein